MTETTVAYHVEDEEGRPAINVKVRAPGLAFWPAEVIAAYGHGDDYPDDNSTVGNLVERAYQRIASDFWQAAQEIATQKGLGEITQEGRSGGWLVFTDGRDPQDANTFAAEADDDGDAHHAIREWLAGYRAMVEWADAWIADAPRKVAALAQQLAMDEAGEDAACRMFAFDVPRPWTCGRMAYVGHGEAHA